MGWFQSAVDSGVNKALADFCTPGGGLHQIVEETVWATMDREMLPRTSPLTALGFVWALRLCFRKRGCSYIEASGLANDTLREFLADEKITYGDPAYAWTRHGAEEVAEEYQFRHWEPAT